MLSGAYISPQNAGIIIISTPIHRCASDPSGEAVKYVNETNQFLYYYASMSLFFSHCYNLKLHNTTTSVNKPEQSKQFIVGVNLCGDSEIVSLIPDGEVADRRVQLFVYFTDTALLSPPAMRCNLNVTTNGLTSYGYVFWNILQQDPDTSRMVIFYNSDFLLFLTQSFVVNVSLNIGPHNISALSKYGYKTATVANVVFVNSDSASQVSFQGFDLPYQRCVQDGNVTAIPPGDSKLGALQLYILFHETPGFTSDVTDILQPMLIHYTAFTKHYREPNYMLRVMKLTGKLSHRVTLRNVSWCDNDVGPYGGPYTINQEYSTLVAQNLAKESLDVAGELYLSIEDVLMRRNYFVDDSRFKTLQCLMCFSHIKQISMTGTNYFAENGGGTVIKLVASELAVSGNLTIMDGYSFQGGGVSLDGSSFLAFQEPLVAGFYHNVADRGSAIYSPAVRCDNNDGVSGVQVWPAKEYSPSNVTSINMSVYLYDNLDTYLKSLHTPFFSFFGNQTSPNLLFDNGTWDSDRSQYAYTTLIDTILHMDRMDKYTSLSNELCTRVQGEDWECYYMDQIIHSSPFQEQCQSISQTTELYPGQVALSTRLLSNQLYDAGYCYPESGQRYMSFRPFKHSLISTTVIRANTTITLGFRQPSPSDNSSGFYVVLLTDVESGIVSIPVLQFNFSDCPPGFCLRNGSCVCDSKLISYEYHCNIDAEGFEGPPGYWTGLVGRSLLFDDHCHPNYCDSDKSDFHLTDDPAEACLGNRTGVLCGECKENYSVVFGSDTCYDHCSDVYLLTIPAYALAGLLLVFLLFALRITVATGTINGLIFYVNVLGLVLEKLTEDRVHISNYVAFVRVFISLLNLDLGFPLCFYEGMTMAGKVGFQFLFPVYLWSIVVMLILLSKCSIRLSRLISRSSVQVLATLFYLSAAKILNTVIIIFGVSAISVIEGCGALSFQHVWYYDGHDYGSSTHAILLALAVAFTVLFLLPFAILTTFSSCFMRFRIVNKFKPFIDAYGGPFKDKFKFWFGFRLWITILLFGLHGVLEGLYLDTMFILYTLVLVAFVVLQALA